jgi:hypothetical protein
MKKYSLSDKDVEAINRLRKKGGSSASISRDSVNFEVGILSKTGYMPNAYGSGDTIADAVNEAIGSSAGKEKVSKSLIQKALNWLKNEGVSDVER